MDVLMGEWMGGCINRPVLQIYFLGDTIHS